MTRQHKLFYGSSYDRGLEHLLKLWPRIRAKVPDATLEICYGWELFDKGYANNPERMAWKARLTALMAQPGITHHGRVSKDQLRTIRQACGIWAYPTDFTEINCITGLDAQYDGCVPCVIALGALKETVQSGLKVEGDIYDEETQDAYLDAILRLLTDTTLWEEEQRKGQAFARTLTWAHIADLWEPYLT